MHVSAQQSRLTVLPHMSVAFGNDCIAAGCLHARLGSPADCSACLSPTICLGLIPVCCASVGVASGNYVFRPALEQYWAQHQPETGAASPADQQPNQVKTADREAAVEAVQAELNQAAGQAGKELAQLVGSLLPPEKSAQQRAAIEGKQPK